MSTRSRCPWCLGDDMMVAYHDTQWGTPVHDDRLHFEMLILEGAQAGLSWRTILHKRAAYQKAFARFDPRRVARFTEADMRRLMANEGIVRNRLKIAGAVRNAIAFLAVQKEFGSFDRYVWGFVDGRAVDRRPRALRDIPTTSDESDRLSADLRRRGFTFVGSTICYAYLQAAGLINDHLLTCARGRDLRSRRTRL